MNRYPEVRVIWGRRKTFGMKQSPVEVEIYYCRKRKWISTGISVAKCNWSNMHHVVGRADALDANSKIDELYHRVIAYVRTLQVQNNPFSWSEFENYMDDGGGGDESFIKFVENLVETKNDITESTRRNHRKFSVALKEFGKIKTFEDLTYINITRYDDWLHGRNNYMQSTIASYHKYMKVYINEAIKRNLISTSPYIGFKVSQGKSSKRKYLTTDQLSAIEKSVMATPSIERVRDMFVFQCYTGLSYSDMKKFDFQKAEKKGDLYVFRDERQKTGEEFYIVLLPKALEILQKYSFKLPVISNEQYNLRLKLVALYAGLKVNLTSHMGRHTYASMCINSGIKIEVLSKMLGHTNVRTTQIYEHMVNATVEDAYMVLETNENIKGMIDSINIVLTSMLSLLNITYNKISLN